MYLTYLKNNNYDLRRQIEISSILDISTIHSFCENLIRKFGININIPNNFKISSYKYEMDEIISSILNDYADREIFKNIQLYKLKDFIKRYYSENENRGLVIPNDANERLFIRHHDVYWDEFKHLFIEIYLRCYKAIEESKKENNVLTQNDLIKYAAVLLQDRYVSKNVSLKYKYLFIDEFQDTSIDQFNLVKAFMDNGVNVFVVGDEKQSIYKFRGSDISSFYEMTDVISEIKKKSDSNSNEIFINENFRTDYELLEIINKIFNSSFRFQNRLIKFNNLSLDKTIECKEPGKRTDKPFQVIYKENLSNIILDLVNNQKIDGEPIKYKDIAILCRRNYDLNNHAMKLKSEGIPTEVVGGKGFYKSKEIIDTYKILNALINKGSLDLEELKFTDYYKAYMSLKSDFSILLEQLSVNIRETVVSNFLDILYKKSGINKYYKNYNNLQAIANLQKLQNIARENMYEESLQPVEFLQFLNIMISTNQEEDEAELSKKDRENGAVSLYSIHKAKGLDFKVVIIPEIDLDLNRSSNNPKIISIVDDSIELAFNSRYLFNNEIKDDPSFYYLLNDYSISNLEEEIRIFYVAMTRAKHKIILTSTRSKSDILSDMKKFSYVSYFSWISEIDRGNFILNFEG